MTYGEKGTKEVLSFLLQDLIKAWNIFTVRNIHQEGLKIMMYRICYYFIPYLVKFHTALMVILG